MNRVAKISLGAAVVLVALGAFAGLRWRSKSTVSNTVSDTAWKAQVEVFVRARDEATAHALPNVLELVDKLGDHVEVDAHLLSSENNAAHDALSRCAINQGAVKGLRFILCRGSMGQGNDDWAPCAEEAGLGKRTLEACASGPQSATLASQSSDEAARRQVTTTPALFVDGKRVDGAGTRQALRAAVCAKASEPPPACTESAEARGFPIVVMTDSRCPECRGPFWFRRMQMLFPSADISVVDVNSAAGRAQYDKVAPGLLPAVSLDARVEKDPGFARLERELVKKNDVYLLSPNTVRPQFDPNKN